MRNFVTKKSKDKNCKTIALYGREYNVDIVNTECIEKLVQYVIDIESKQLDPEYDSEEHYNFSCYKRNNNICILYSGRRYSSKDVGSSIKKCINFALEKLKKDIVEKRETNDRHEKFKNEIRNMFNQYNWKFNIRYDEMQAKTVINDNLLVTIDEDWEVNYGFESTKTNAEIIMNHLPLMRFENLPKYTFDEETQDWELEDDDEDEEDDEDE